MGSEAKKIIEDVISEVLTRVEGEMTPRQALDAYVHILDLSYHHVMRANRLPLTDSTKKSYDNFIAVVANLAHASMDLPEAVNKVINIKGTQYINSLNLLVCKSFGTAREFITEVSKKIPLDPYFGTSYRERTLQELELAKNIKNGVYTQDFKDKAFVIQGNKIGQIQEFGSGDSATYYMVPIYSSINSQFLAIKDRDGSITVEPASKHLGARVSTEKGTIELVQTNEGEIPLLKRDYLSKLDLGHMFKKNILGGETPLGLRLQDALAYTGLSTDSKAIVQKYIDQLYKVHGSVDYVFHNQAAKGSETTIDKNVGFVVLTVQGYRENNRLAVIETRIKKQLIAKFKEIALSLPGSNTILEDINEKLTNIVVKTLGGKTKRLKQHIPVKGTVEGPKGPKLKVTTQQVSGPSKTKQSSKSKAKLPVIQHVGYSLTSLKALLDYHLQDVISANMGDGGERKVLNYRTGRFAASAKVEYLTQSREGMITAFYSYMKYPYQTFEPGFRQGSPTSRDPKLLIAKSIRQIAETKVTNKLRSVSI
jgi:hypothetical protein